MKKILTIIVLSLFFIACNKDKAPENVSLEEFSDESKKVNVQVDTAGNTIPQKITSPPIPNVVTFAGDTLPIYRDDVREGLEQELLVNTFRHSHTLWIIKKLERWRPLIEQTLEDNNVPVDFIYLAVAESEFDNTAQSYAGAMGMWQFMSRTARDYDLEMNRDVDMRRDPKQSTIAAAKYLKWAYKELNNWTLAAASYNRGVHGIKEKLKEQSVDNFFDLHLNTETARYVYRIVSFKLILENPQAYGFFVKPYDKYSPYEFETIKVEEDIDDLVEYAAKYDISYKELRLLNPYFNNTSSYKLRVPRRSSYELRVPILSDSTAKDSVKVVGEASILQSETD